MFMHSTEHRLANTKHKEYVGHSTMRGGLLLSGNHLSNEKEKRKKKQQ